MSLKPIARLALALILGPRADAPTDRPACRDERSGVVSRLVVAIATIEGYYTPGTPARMLKNPGCLRRGSIYIQFETEAEGFKALRDRIEGFAETPLSEALRVYNTETESYAAVVLQIAGVRPDVSLSTLPHCK